MELFGITAKEWRKANTRTGAEGRGLIGELPSGGFTKRIVDYQIRHRIKIPLIPGYEDRIQ